MRKAVTLWFELLQAWRLDLSSQTSAVSRVVRRSWSPGTGPRKFWEEGLPREPPLVMTVNPRAAQRGRPDSEETWAQSVSHQMDFRKTSGPHKDAPPAQPSCKAGALGESPHVRPDLTS